MKTKRFGILIYASVLIALFFISIPNANAQNSMKKYGEDSIQCITSQSLYTEFYKQGNYKDALPHWRYVFNNCPLASQNTYIHGVKIMSEKLNATSDVEKRNKIIDTIMMVYDNRITYFGHDSRSREGMIRGRQALELMNLRPADSMIIYNYFKKSVDIEKYNVDPIVASNYFLYVNNLVNTNIFPPDSLISAYDQMSDVAEHNINECKINNSNDLENWTNLKALVESVFEPFATCDQLINIYTKKFTQTPDDTTLLKKITFMLERKDCTDSDLFLQATEKLHKLLPNPTSAYLMGKLMLRESNFDKAESYLLEAIPGLTEELKEKAYYSLAALKVDQKSYSSARNYLYKCLEINPNGGKYYIMIGDMYAASASSCSGENEIDSRAVYWTAVDKYLKAKSVDSSVADDANTKINRYSAHFPTKERLFFNEIQEGSRYSVGCWIGESTTVRASR